MYQVAILTAPRGQGVHHGASLFSAEEMHTGIIHHERQSTRCLMLHSLPSGRMIEWKMISSPGRRMVLALGGYLLRYLGNELSSLGMAPLVMLCVGLFCKDWAEPLKNSLGSSCSCTALHLVAC